jgi:hypothetical protein
MKFLEFNLAHMERIQMVLIDFSWPLPRVFIDSKQSNLGGRISYNSSYRRKNKECKILIKFIQILFDNNKTSAWYSAYCTVAFLLRL